LSSGLYFTYQVVVLMLRPKNTTDWFLQHKFHHSKQDTPEKMGEIETLRWN
jgi:hypothetical protein